MAERSNGRANSPVTRPRDSTMTRWDDGEDLLQLGAHPHDGGTVGGGVEQAVGDGRRRAGVEPAGRVARDDEVGHGVELAGQHELLGVAARQAAHGRARPGRAHVPRPQARRRRRGAGRGAAAATTRRGRARRCRRGSSAARARCGSGPRGCRRCRGRSAPAASRAGTAVAVERHGPGVGRLDTGEHGLQLGLPVAVDAGHAEHLAGAHGERRRRAGRRGDTPSTSRRTGAPSATGRPDVARWAAAERPADHRVGERGDGVVGDRASASTTAPSRSTVTRSQPSTTSPRRWVMITTARPSSARRRHTASSPVASVAGEHRGRLVEQQDPGVGVEGAQDLQPLLLAHGELGDRHAVAHVEAEALDELGEALAGHPGRRHERPGRPGEDEVLRRRQRRDQREVLLHERHAAVGERSGRRARRPARPTARRARRRVAPARRGSARASSCRHRSRRAGRGSRPAAARGRCRAAR